MVGFLAKRSARHSFRLFAAGALCLMASGHAAATTMVHYSAQRLIDESGLIIVGTVSSKTKETLDVQEFSVGSKNYWLYHIAVEQILKGDATRVSILIRRYPGITASCTNPSFCDTPFLDVGAKYLLFLNHVDGLMYRVTNLTGKYKFGIDPYGAREVLIEERGAEIIAIEDDEWVLLRQPALTPETQQYFTMRDDGFVEADLDAFDASFPPLPVYDHTGPGPVEIPTRTLEETERRNLYSAAKARQEIFETYYERWAQGADAVIAAIKQRVRASEAGR